MFSYLSRGYGTWEGIAKLETPDSAISTHRGNYVLPPINKGQHRIFEQHVDHDELYRIPQEKFKLPEMPKNSLHIPKTYTTKSGALLLYSEGCFVPGSRRLKKRPRFKRQKERQLQTLKDLMELIMEYKKNGCDPLLLEQLWQRMRSRTRDVQPGYSPKRYLNHLSQTTFDPDAWKKLVETGSLKSFGNDEGFLPPLLPDNDYGDHLKHRPPPYKTMSLPPVSPSSSMLGSFTFYKHALSTGAASMVSLPSVNSEPLSAKTAGSFVESLADRLAEVESEAGFKRDYNSLTAEEKGEILTQLLMDVTLHHQQDVITVPTTQNLVDSSTENTDISYISDGKSSKSPDSLRSHNEAVHSEDSLRTTRSNETAKSFTSDKSPSRSTSVCSLPPIVSKDDEGKLRRSVPGSVSSSGSGLSLVADDLAIALNGIDVEIEDDLLYLEDRSIGLDTHDSDTRSLRSEKTFSEYSLIDALDIQDAESLHQMTDETKSLKSLGSSHGVMTARTRQHVGDGALVHAETIGDDDLGNGVAQSDDGDDILGGVGDVHGDDYSHSGSDGDTSGDIKVTDTDGTLDENTNQTIPTFDVDQAPELETPHISLSSLQNEVRLVAEEVLSRPKSGRILAEDAKMATFLLVQRMEGLLGPAMAPDNIRVNSAVPKKLRPLGQPRNNEVKQGRRPRTAEATLASTILVNPEENTVKADEDLVTPGEDHTAVVSSDERGLHGDVEDDGWSKTDGIELSVDDVIVAVDTVEEIRAQSVEIDIATPLPESELLTVKDVHVEQAQEKREEMKGMKEGMEKEMKEEMKGMKKEMKEDVAGKARKESVQKGSKAKKGTKGRGSVAKAKKKKAPIARARNEPPKTPPFRAGLVPESKPPKGLEQKSGEPRQKESDKQASPDLQAKTEPKTKETKTLSVDIPSPEKLARVDSETGEVEHRVSPPRSEQSPASLAGSKSPEDERRSVSREDLASLRSQTNSPRDESPSVHENTPSPRDKTPSPRDKTPSPRDKTPSPRAQKPCPRDRDAVPREHVSSNVVTESVEPEVREPSPEVVLTEKQRRANARTAQRAAAAERRRQEVERKRREREEARRRAQEEEVRLDVLRKEAEIEMQKREEERREQKEKEERERMHLEAEQNERARQERLMVERQRQAREDWKRKKEQLMAQRKFEEELRKEREQVEEQIEEERRREYEEKIAHLEEEERERLLEERRLDEERIKREIEEEKRREEEERRRVLEERRKMEEELAAARERQMARRTFLQTLLQDFQNLLLDQRITRAFTFSYFDILPWFKDRWRDLHEDRPSLKRDSTPLDTVPEETETELEQFAGE